MTKALIPKAQAPPEHYSTNDVVRMVGCTYRQLDYWCRVGLIPGQSAARPGSGGRREWMVDDIARARLVFLASRLSSGPLARIVDLLESELAFQQIELRAVLTPELGEGG